MRHRRATRRPHAVVVGLDCMTGLQTARILAARGVRVVGVARDTTHYCCRTRVCERVVQADTTGRPLVDALNALGPTLGERAILIPCTDLAVALVSRHRARLSPWYRIALPHPAVVERLMDKLDFHAWASGAGFPVPATALVRTRADAERAARELHFPCVLKPAMKTARWQAHTAEKAFPARDGAELLAIYERCAAWSDSLLVQEWIEGGEDCLYSFNGYFGRDGTPLATFVARKLRQWPPQTGTSCLGEEVRNDAVLELALSLFGAVGYRGLAYLEVKRCAVSGRHVIIEPNVGRPTGRSAIAEAGGVELVHTMYCDLAGTPLPEARTQAYTGVKWIYWRRDLQAASRGWRRGELGLRDWYRSWRGRKACAVWSLRDPMPFLCDLARLVRLASTGRRRSEPRSTTRPRSARARI